MQAATSRQPLACSATRSNAALRSRVRLGRLRRGLAGGREAGLGSHAAAAGRAPLPSGARLRSCAAFGRAPPVTVWLLEAFGRRRRRRRRRRPPDTTHPRAPRVQAPQRALRRAQQLRVRAEAEVDKAAVGEELDNPESEAARKKAEADRLRAAEKFMVVGTGEASCKNCGYEYKPSRGDPEYPVAPGTQFQVRARRARAGDRRQRTQRSMAWGTTPAGSSRTAG